MPGPSLPGENEGTGANNGAGGSSSIANIFPGSSIKGNWSGQQLYEFLLQQFPYIMQLHGLPYQFKGGPIDSSLTFFSTGAAIEWIDTGAYIYSNVASTISIFRTLNVESLNTSSFTLTSLSSGRVVFTDQSNNLTSSSNLLFNGTKLTIGSATNEASGLRLGSTVDLYEGTTNRLDTSDSVYLTTGTLGVGIAPATAAGIGVTKTAIAGDFNGAAIFATRTEATTGTTANRCLGLAFSGTTGGSGAFSSIFAAIGMEGFGQHIGSGQSQGAHGGAFGVNCTGAGELVRAVGITINAPSRTGAGHITNTRMIDIAGPNAFTANGQARLGIRIGAMPVVSGFTGTTNFAFQFNSATGSSMDGIWWSTDTNIFRLRADTLATEDEFAFATVGKGLRIREGTNAVMGVVSLNGSALVATNVVAASSRIFLTTQAPSGVVGTPYVSSRAAGISFSITSTSTGDASLVAWMIVQKD